MAYIKQLDSLRAIAIFFVLCHHWLPEDNVLHELSSYVSAPNIFFTISGFLITLILLKDRKKAEDLETGKTKVFTDFFLKRSLRIFPAYYLTILAAYLIKPDSVPDYSSYLNFTANFEIYGNRSWAELGHLWSMSVEQQFYLFWPLLMLFMPERFLLHTILSFILLGMVCQNIIPRDDFSGVLPQTCFDALGIGALLAWVVLFRNPLLPRFYRVLRLLGIISMALVAGQAIWGYSDLYVHNRTLIAVIVAWLMAYFILEGNAGKGSLGLLFNNRALFLIGKMSYGIYLYHLTLFYHIHGTLGRVNRFVPLPRAIKDTPYFYIFESLVVLFAIAWLSWRFYEMPITKLKVYLRRETPAKAASQMA